MSRLLVICVLSLLSAVGQADTVSNNRNIRVERMFLDMEAQSGSTQRRQITTIDSPVDPGVFTRLRKAGSDGHQAFSNATLIAGGNCYWLASTAGHSILDQRYDRPANRGDIAVNLPDGSWVNPVEILVSPRLNWRSDEIDDWALLVLLAPRCQFDDHQSFERQLPHLPSSPVSEEALERCSESVQMLCYHFDQGVPTGSRMVESGCRMEHLTLEDGSIGYSSCKVDYGVSGCSPVCRQGDDWINLGVFSKGLMRHERQSSPQPVSAFRVFDGEFAAAFAQLRQKYGLE